MNYKETLNISTSIKPFTLSRSIGVTVPILIVLTLIIPSAALSADWEDDFEDICSRVVAADSYSIEELQALIDRSDKLLKKIKASDNRRNKIFIMRLKKCRNFFAFTIEVKQGEESQ